MPRSQLYNALQRDDLFEARGLIMSLVQVETVNDPLYGPRVVMVNVNLNEEVQDFLESSPCIIRARQFNYMLNELYNIDAANKVLLYINQVENEMMLLIGLYIFTSSTFSGVLGYDTCGLFFALSLLASVSCKHANTFGEFYDNMKISVNEKVFTHFNWICDTETVRSNQYEAEIAR